MVPTLPKLSSPCFKTTKCSSYNILKNKSDTKYNKMVKVFLSEMPEGVKYTPLSSNASESTASGQKSGSEKDVNKGDDDDLSWDAKNPDIVAIGEFTINMSVIEKHELLKMRLMLPAAGYKLLKNRKNARLCRARKKEAV